MTFINEVTGKIWADSLCKYKEIYEDALEMSDDELFHIMKSSRMAYKIDSYMNVNTLKVMENKEY